jgi:hypothetical protein
MTSQYSNASLRRFYASNWIWPRNVVMKHVRFDEFLRDLPGFREQDQAKAQ